MHKHGGTDEVGTETPGANQIVKAQGDGKIADGWLSNAIARLVDLTWGAVSGKPSTFPAESHGHAQVDVENLVSDLAGKAGVGDGRFPTADEKSALGGTNGTPGIGNKFVTNSDHRLSDSRTPTAHPHPVDDLSDATEEQKEVLRGERLPVRELVHGGDFPSEWAVVRKGGLWLYRGMDEGMNIVDSATIAPVSILNWGDYDVSIETADSESSVLVIPRWSMVTFAVNADLEAYDVSVSGIPSSAITSGTISVNRLPTASTSQKGIAQFASDGEIQTGTDTSKVVRVSGLAAWWAWVKTQAQTLAGNVTLGSSSGNAHEIKGAITASHATATGASNIANVGALDGRYPAKNITVSSPGTIEHQPPVNVYGTYNLAGAVRSISSLTRSGTTATAVCAGHGYTTGMRIAIVGASPAGFNGEYPITVVDPDTWTYTLDSDPGSDATGTIVAYNLWVQLFLSTVSLGNVVMGEVTLAVTAAGSGDHLRFGITGGNTASLNGIPTLIERSGYGWVDTIRCSRNGNTGLCVEVRLNDASRSYVISATYRPVAGLAPAPALVGGSPGPIGSGSNLNCIAARLPSSRVVPLDPPSIAAGALGSVLTVNDITQRQVLVGGYRRYVTTQAHPLSALPSGLVLISVNPEGTIGQIRLTFWNTSGSTIDAAATNFLISTSTYVNNL